MSQSPHKKTYSAADIIRYHAGEMTPAERHAIEKAALDDPFLADAMEGYLHAPGAAEDLNILQARLDEKISGTRRTFILIPVWMRIVALFIILAGAGFIVYRLTFVQKDPVAYEQNLSNNRTDTIHITANGKPDSNATPADTADASVMMDMPAEYKKDKKATAAKVPAAKKPAISFKNETDNRMAGITAAAPAERAARPLSAPVYLREKYTPDTAGSTKAENALQGETFTLKGRITDKEGQPVPNASIIQSGTQKSIMTDKDGQFSLSISDSSKKLVAAAIGYEPKQIPVKGLMENHNIVLQESGASLQEVVVTGIGNKRSRSETRTLQTKAAPEILEPEEGWSAYNNYLSAQLKIPQEVKSKQISGEVRLSFDIDKNGEPVNIKVEKSLCETCDQEAIRLLKEGPAWKRKKKARGRLTIHF